MMGYKIVMVAESSDWCARIITDNLTISVNNLKDVLHPKLALLEATFTIPGCIQYLVLNFGYLLMTFCATLLLVTS